MAMRDGNGEGVATITVSSVDARGQARALIALDFSGVYDLRPWTIRPVVIATIEPDGGIHTDRSLGVEMDQLFNFISSTATQFAARPLRSNENWRSAQKFGSLPGSITYGHKVVGQKQYRSFPAFVIDTQGAATYQQMMGHQAVQAQTSVKGSSYYDARDKLYLGCTLRSLTVAQLNGGKGGQLTASTAVNIMLRSLDHTGALAPPPLKGSGTGAKTMPSKAGSPSGSSAPSAVLTSSPSASAAPTPGAQSSAYGTTRPYGSTLPPGSYPTPSGSPGLSR